MLQFRYEGGKLPGLIRSFEMNLLCFSLFSFMSVYLMLDAQIKHKLKIGFGFGGRCALIYGCRHN